MDEKKRWNRWKMGEEMSSCHEDLIKCDWNLCAMNIFVEDTLYFAHNFPDLSEDERRVGMYNRLN